MGQGKREKRSKLKILTFREGPWGGCILQWTIMEVIVVIFLGFEKCSCIQFLTLVEYNKKGLNYVKVTHEVYFFLKTHQNYECLIGNGLYNLGEIKCHKL
jgi:hypothetical protein